MKVLSSEKQKKSRVILHKKDKKILKLLCTNIRLPLSKIAGLLKMSRQSVEYRISVMQREHLLAGSRTVINIKKLEYYSFHFFINIQTKESEKEIVDRCLKSEYVNALISYSGKYNYEISIMAKTPKEANEEFLSLIENTRTIEYSPTIIIETVKSVILPLIDEEKEFEIKRIKNDPSFSKFFTEKEKSYNADSTDLKILYILSQNAKIPISEIGKKVNMSKDAVSYRIKKLVSARYILQFRPAIDFSVLNLKVQTILIKAANRDKEKDKKFKDYIKNSNFVLWGVEIFGDWNYLIYVITERQEEIHKFINNLKENFSDYIQTYEILFAYEEYKYAFMNEAMKKR